MAKARVAMNVIEEVLRLHHECGRSQREIARSCGLSAGAVNKLLRPAWLAWRGHCRRIWTRHNWRNACMGGQPARGGADSWRGSTSLPCTGS